MRLNVLVGAILATVQNPENFTVFEDSSGSFQMAVPFFETTGEGLFCIDLDLATSGISGVKDGANVTLQLIFDGGDGQLYQVRCIEWRDETRLIS